MSITAGMEGLRLPVSGSVRGTCNGPKSLKNRREVRRIRVAHSSGKTTFTGHRLCGEGPGRQMGSPRKESTSSRGTQASRVVGPNLM